MSKLETLMNSAKEQTATERARIKELKELSSQFLGLTEQARNLIATWPSLEQEAKAGLKLMNQIPQSCQMIAQEVNRLQKETGLVTEAKEELRLSLATASEKIQQATKSQESINQQTQKQSQNLMIAVKSSQNSLLAFQSRRWETWGIAFLAALLAALLAAILVAGVVAGAIWDKWPNPNRDAQNGKKFESLYLKLDKEKRKEVLHILDWK